MECAVEDCTRTTHARGYCGMHYARWYRHGDPVTQVRLRDADLLDRLWFRTTVVGECWKYDGNILHYRRPDGRGDYRGIKVDGRMVGAHVASYEYHHGPLPDGVEVHHRCGTKECWRPEHLDALSHLEHRRAHMKNECRHGHPYDEANTGQQATGRRCRQCRREAQARYRDRVRAERA